MIQFEKRKLKATIRNPLMNFSVDQQEIEIRKDPLTGRVSRLNVERSKRAHPGLAESSSIKPILEKSKQKCPFCQKNIFKITPKFVDIKERFIHGSSVIVPNLYPFSVYHGVVVLSPKKHYLALNEISPKILFDSLKNSMEFFKTVNQRNPDFKYPSINFNYMPPAGASVIHPHFQILVDDEPTFMPDLLTEKSFEYFKKTGKNFWLDLVETEKKNKERFIGETGSFSWLADFSPLKNNQISGICKGVSNFSQLKLNHLKDLSNGLSKIFKKLWEKNVRSLNMSIFSSPIDEDLNYYFHLNLKIISRPALSKYVVSDIGFIELMHQEPVIETMPEEVAKSLRFG